MFLFGFEQGSGSIAVAAVGMWKSDLWAISKGGGKRVKTWFCLSSPSTARHFHGRPRGQARLLTPRWRILTGDSTHDKQRRTRLFLCRPDLGVASGCASARGFGAELTVFGSCPRSNVQLGRRFRSHDLGRRFLRNLEGAVSAGDSRFSRALLRRDGRTSVLRRTPFCGRSCAALLMAEVSSPESLVRSFRQRTGSNTGGRFV